MKNTDRIPNNGATKSVTIQTESNSKTLTAIARRIEKLSDRKRCELMAILLLKGIKINAYLGYN